MVHPCPSARPPCVCCRQPAEVKLSEQIEIARSEVRMPEGVIRVTGEYEIDLQLHSDVTVTIQVNVVAE